MGQLTLGGQGNLGDLRSLSRIKKGMLENPLPITPIYLRELYRVLANFQRHGERLVELDQSSRCECPDEVRERAFC